MPLGPSASYVVSYNGYQLPGYVQEESSDISLGTISNISPYGWAGGVQQYAGIHNKTLSLRLRVWEQDYRTCREEIYKAAVYLLSKQDIAANLYVGYTDRHLVAMPKSVKISSEAKTNVRIQDYDVEFDCRPFYIGDTTYTMSGVVSGSLLLTTESQSPPPIEHEGYLPGGRNPYNGTWTPVRLTITNPTAATPVTISGYLEDQGVAPTGYMVISGAVTDMVIDTESLTSTISGQNANDRMLWTDYHLYVGQGKTCFAITGSNAQVTIYYENRWPL